MNNIVITGSSGQLGLTLKDLLVGFKDMTFDFKPSTKLDITNLSSINEIFKKNNYSHFINCAAYTNVEQAEKTPEPAFKVNAEGVRNLAHACKEHGTTLIHISTDYVFDGEKDT